MIPVSGPGNALTDHRGVALTLGPDECAYQDDDGRIVVQPTNPHPLLRTKWVARTKGELPEVQIVGVQTLSDRTIELSIAAVEFGADLLDEWGHRVAVRAISLDGLLTHWRRTGKEEDTITSILAQLGRLG